VAYLSRNRDREGLEQELRNREYQELLHALQWRTPFLRQFETWADVIAFMRNGTSQDPRKDEVLRPIFETHGEDQNPRWRTILLVFFWTSLESIHNKKRHWDPVYPDDLWQNIVWTFIQVVCRIDVKRRPARLVQKIYNDTLQHLYDEYLKAWARMSREVLAEPEEIESLAGGAHDTSFAAFEFREEREQKIQRLREHMEAGRITEADFLLIVGTKVYGNSLVDYARQAGIDYQVAKKRRQRAETVIRRFQEERR
jgi:hypothetical protein